MDFEEYDYLEKTVENPLLEKESANGGDEIVKSEEKEQIKNSRHWSYKKREKEENEQHSKRLKSEDESRSVHHSRSRDVERHHQSRFRDNERNRHKSSGNNKEKEKDREREDRTRKQVKKKDKEHERAQKTVFVYQIASKATERDIYEFFSRAGKVRDVRLILSGVIRRFTGNGYVEFHDTISVPMAIALSGQLLLDQPVMVKPSEAEKNLVQPTTAAARRLYVGNLHVDVSEKDLQEMFEVFGSLERVQVSRDETGHSKGVGVVQFERIEDARNAVNLDGELEIAGGVMRVSKYPL